MTLRLVASGNERALAIRDHVLPLLRREGILEVQRDTVRLVEHRMEPWVFRYWTPFSALVPGEASSPAGPAVRARGVARYTGAACPVGG